MYRGTTPTIIFRFDKDKIDLAEVKELWLTFRNHPSLNLITYDKSRTAIDTDDNTVIIELEQEDTLKFESGSVDVQIRLLLNNNKAYSTPIKSINVEKILKGGVIGE